MLENELIALKQKRDENMRLAYESIIKSDEKSYKNQLEIILSHFGIDYRLKEDTFEKQLKEIKNKFDINSRIVTLNGEWYKNGVLPLFVSGKAVIPDLSGKYGYYKSNKTVKITSKNAGEFAENGLCFYKGFAAEKISRGYLLKYLLKCVSVGEYALVLGAMIAVTLFSTVMPYARYYIFNNLIPAGTKSDIMPISCLLTGVIAISLVIYIFRGIITANIPLKAGVNLQGAVLSRLLRLKTSFFTNEKSGSLSNGIMKISDISDIFSGETVTAVFSFFLSVIYAVQIYIYAGEFMTFVYFALGIVLLLTVVNAYCVNRHSKAFSEKTNNMTGFVYELFGGMENIKLNNAESVMFRRFGEVYSDSLKAIKKPFITKYYSGIYALVISAFTLIIYVIGIREKTQTADFITFMSLYGLFIGSVGGISSALNAFARFNAAYKQLEGFFTAEIEETDNKQSIDRFEGNIEFSNISFKYKGSEKNVIDNISFSVKAGQKIGITGKSGCGKSTLIRLLLGFEKPEGGRIFIDNRDLAEVNLEDYRKRLGVVLQSSKLIPGDIYSNIILTNPTADLTEVNKAIEAVGLKEDIEKMPMGVYTFVSDDNMTISGGQKQRILLARAIIGKPSLLVLDEATNALDNITQAAVTRYINGCGITAVIIAHRLSTIKNCDNIIVLDGGRIAEQGSFDELLKRKGEFYSLIKQQL